MKTGISIRELAQEVQRQAQNQRDFIADPRLMSMNPYGSELSIADKGKWLLKQIAHQQLASFLKIPQKYYERMQNEAPEILALNANYWLHQKPVNGKSNNRMVRVLDDNVRAVLSSSYRPMGNYDLMAAVMPILSELDLNVVSCQITDKSMYLKTTYSQLQRDIGVGDVVEAGVVISNSETGFRRLMIAPFVNRLVCSNGMIVNDAGFAKRHVGRSWDDNDGLPREIMSDETRRKDDEALWSKVRDVIKATCNEEHFDGYCRKFVESKEVKIDVPVMQAVEVTAKNLALNQEEKDNVFEALIRGNDLTAWGMANAVTSLANTTEDYDRATELETLGGRVVELKNRVWKA